MNVELLRWMSSITAKINFAPETITKIQIYSCFEYNCVCCIRIGEKTHFWVLRHLDDSFCLWDSVELRPVYIIKRQSNKENEDAILSAFIEAHKLHISTLDILLLGAGE